MMWRLATVVVLSVCTAQVPTPCESPNLSTILLTYNDTFLAFVTRKDDVTRYHLTLEEICCGLTFSCFPLGARGGLQCFIVPHHGYLFIVSLDDLSHVTIKLAFGCFRPATPEQWQARLVRFDGNQPYEIRAKLFYDNKEQRRRTTEEIVNSTAQREFYDILQLHKNKTLYILNLKTRKCNTTIVDMGFAPYSIPPGSKFVVEGVLGPANMPKEHITFQQWEGNITWGIHWQMSVELPSCEPISLDYSYQNSFITEKYLDMVEGIPDPSAFDPPPECKKP